MLDSAVVKTPTLDSVFCLFLAQTAAATHLSVCFFPFSGGQASHFSLCVCQIFHSLLEAGRKVSKPNPPTDNSGPLP